MKEPKQLRLALDSPVTSPCARRTPPKTTSPTPPTSQLVVLGNGLVADSEVVRWMFGVESRGVRFEVGALNTAADAVTAHNLEMPDRAFFHAHGAEVYRPVLEFTSRLM